MKREETFCDVPDCDAMRSKQRIRSCSLCNSDVCDTHFTLVPISISDTRLHTPGCFLCLHSLTETRQQNAQIIPADVYGVDRFNAMLEDIRIFLRARLVETVITKHVV